MTESPSRTPTPTTRPFLTAEWRDLLMLNYEVAPDVLQPLVPAGTELDEWNGTIYLSVVGFRFLDTRVLGVSVPGHRDFEEVNLRFYVRRRGPEGWRRGVVFVRELVPRHAIAWTARTLYNEPYRALPMRHAVERDTHDTAVTRVRYEWQAPNGWEGISAKITGQPAALTTGSEAEFITEHYWGYTRQRNGDTIEYQVSHPSWRVWDARDAALRCDVSSLYGPAFAEALSATPRSAFVADGSAITVFQPSRLDGLPRRWP